MHCLLLKVLTIYILQEHIVCVTLSASPNYISAFVDIKLICKLDESIENVNIVTFGRNSSIIGSVKCSNNMGLFFHRRHKFRRCHFRDKSCCDYINNTVKLTYKPFTTPITDETFYCDVNGDMNSTTLRPAVSPSSTEFKITQGNTVENITCSAECWPICTFQWIGQNYKNEGAELLLENITISQSGRYRCKAKNSLRTESSKYITMDVLYAPETVVLSPSKEIYTRTEGSSIRSITCSADCNPVCNITWMYPDKRTLPRSYIYEYSLEKTHDGEYTCKAFNEIGYKEKSVTVIVNYAPFDVQLSPNSTSFIVEENKHVLITCSADCRPQCEYQWTGQTDWSSSNKHLIIRYAKKADSGSLRCAARNNVGYTYSSYVRVTVHSRPTKVETIAAKSQGSTTVSIAWIPDMSVIPRQNFTVQYKRRNYADFTNMPFEEYTNQQNIYLLHVKSLTPSTEYVFKILSENYLGRTESTEVRFVTKGEPIASIRPDLVCGISLISIAVLIIIITFVIVQRFLLIKYGSDTTIGGSRCKRDGTTKPERSTNTEESLYEITNLQLLNIGSSVEASRDNNVSTHELGDTPHDNFLRTPADRNLTDKQHVRLTATEIRRQRNKLLVQYANITAKNKKINDRVEKKALKPLIMPKPKMKT
ncbi:neural cell adhesion molecule 2-like isoform X2 [Mytilus edulis]|uniref:neural cell adhesion molecule 2-like isoform X2 n=1 Tax=Mytilus edulis TaxID=6550 RepID=UPI0039F0BF83